MTSVDLKHLLDTVVTDLNMAADFAGVIDPALIPFIAIGKAVDKLVPGIASSVQSWVEGNAPTDAEKADTLAKIGVLSDPNLP